MARRRRTFGSGAFRKGTTGIIIEDEVTSFTKLASINFPKETDRAVRHVGYVIRRRVLNYFENDKHDQPLSMLQKQQTIDKLKTGSRRSSKKHAGDVSTKGRGLRKAVRFQHEKGKQKVVVGWASNDARRRSGPRFQKGSQSVVTEKMKNMFFAMARTARGANKRRLFRMAHLPVGYIIRNPRRPIFDPVYQQMKGILPKLFEKRIERNLGLLEEEAYNAILLTQTGINENEVASTANARRGRRRKAG